ncbi:MAG: histidine kinase, partial [Methylomonas sp.]
MRLQRHLLTRIILAALLCLLATAGYTLYQAHRQAGELTRQTAESIVKQLRQQLLLTEAGIGRSEPFPDFDAWKQSGGQPGMCISYTGKATQQTHSICNGEKWLTPDWPDGFALLYRRLFPDQQVITQTVQFNGREYGVLTVAGSAETEIAGAWRAVSGLLQLSAITIFAVCLLVTLTIRRALRPVTAIVAGVGRMEAAQPDYRLPFFELYEWQCIAAAINRLTARQQQLLAERQQLIAKLLQIQEDERRHLSRELHDELGQCLVAIQAVAASIKQSAAEKNPEIAAEAEHIGRITRHALDGARHLLMRLRPP